MKRVIVDYAKLTNDILDLLVEKFQEGYEETDVILFTNAKGEIVDAVEVRTEDTIYLVKVSKRLAERMVSHEEEEDLELDLIDVPPVDIKVDDDDLPPDDEEEFEYDQPDEDTGEDEDS